MFRNFSAVISFLALAGLVFAGCAATSPTKSEAPSLPVSSASPPRASGEKTAQAARQQTPTSSLDAHREGRPPASGPLAEIYFDFDSYDLSADARRSLQTHAVWLKANPSARVEIE